MSDRLEITDRRGNIIEYLKEGSEACQLQSIQNPLRDRSQHNLPAIVTLAIALPDQQGPEAGTGHVFQLT